MKTDHTEYTVLLAEAASVLRNAELTPRARRQLGLLTSASSFNTLVDAVYAVEELDQ